MKFLKLRIQDWRGVTGNEVAFAPTGVTVIEGDNELGKTSLTEAVDLLFDALDSSTAGPVKAVRPVGRDVGSQVELEVETGPYHFIYRKQFHKRPSTELRVIAPAVESLVGRDAHARVLEILADTVDVPLWKALRLQQGVAIDQADLTGQTSLAAALDAAAAADLGGGREETLYTRVVEEWLKYWTRTNKPIAARTPYEHEAITAVARLEDVESRLTELALDVERCDALSESLKVAQKSLSGDKVEEQHLAKRFAEVESLRSSATELRGLAQQASQQLTIATSKAEAREKLVGDVADAEERKQDAQQTYDALAKQAPDAQSLITAAKEAADELQRQVEEARKDATRAGRDLAHLHDIYNLTALEERQGYVHEARNQLTTAAEELATNAVDAGLLKKLEAAYVEFAQADARLHTEGPRIELVSNSELRLTVNDEEVTVPPAELQTWTVTDRTTLSLPGTATITVSAGRSLVGAQEELTKRSSTLASLLQQARSADIAEARLAGVSRAEAEANDKAANAQLVAALRDLTEQELAGKIISHTARIDAYIATRPTDPELPLDTGTARVLEESEQERVSKLEIAAAETRAHYERTRDAAQKSETDLVALVTKLEAASGEYLRPEDKLTVARAETTDEVIERRLTEAELQSAAAESKAAEGEAAYAEAKPESIEVALINVREVIKGATRSIREDEDELTGLRSRLQLRGEADLYDERIAALGAVETTSVKLARWDARAAAARRLYEVMSQARSHAQEAYVGPLRERIESFAQIVFGPSVQVELGTDLRINARILNGERIEFKSLSTGAREQLSLISRLACACLVSEAGGVPLLLDDALGNSDPGRLRDMGAVLALAGRSCQVIVLTCVPDRYRHIGGATVVPLRRT
jgi:hypothetical protein